MFKKNAWAKDSTCTELEEAASPHFDGFVFMPMPYPFYYYSSLAQPQFGDDDTFLGSFVIQDCFCYPMFFEFLYDTENYPFKICE